MEKTVTLEEALKRIEELEKENAELREELEYYRNRKLSGRQKHNAKWMAIYNDFVVGYESGMTMVEIAKRNNVSERTIYRYKAYYDKGTSAGERICGEALAAKAAAGTEVSPVGIIGYYYPATVYAAENGMLYCVHEYESDVRVFADVEEILAYELQVHRPIRIERRR